MKQTKIQISNKIQKINDELSTLDNIKMNYKLSVKRSFEHNIEVKELTEELNKLYEIYNKFPKRGDNDICGNCEFWLDCCTNVESPFYYSTISNWNSFLTRHDHCDGFQ